MKHLFKIATAALLLMACTKANTPDGATSVIDGSQNAVQLAGNTWEITQRISSEGEKDRLRLSLPTADHDPVGLRRRVDSNLIVKVTVLIGNALPKLLVGTYDREKVRVVDLLAGSNTVSGATGDLYIKFSSDQPSPDNKVKVEFISGYKKIPFYIQGKTTNAQWKSMLATDTTPNVALVSQRTFIVCSRAKAIEYQDKLQDSVLYYLDKGLNAEHTFSGLDGSSPVDRTWEGKIMIVERSGGYMDATANGRVRISDDVFGRVLDPSLITGNGWGIFHEMGHHHQQWVWTFSTSNEVVPNIYTIAAQRVIHPGYKWLKDEKWRTLAQFFKSDETTRDFSKAAVSGGDVGLAMFQQLWLAFGDSFYHKLHKLIRAERPTASGDPEEMRIFMLYASRASGKDLGGFFKKYGFKVNQSVFDEITNLGLPKPEVDPTTLSEGGALSEGVVFYSEKDYKGIASDILVKGNYSQSALGTRDVGNDRASSVEIPAGWKVIIYENGGFGGKSWTLTSSTNDLSMLSPSADNVASSIKIE